MRISDRTLRRWLRTGRPNRVERRIEDPDVVCRLEAMTELSDADRRALHEMTEPEQGFEDRVAIGISTRSESETVGLLFDLMGLGWHATSAMIDPPAKPEQ